MPLEVVDEQRSRPTATAGTGAVDSLSERQIPWWAGAVPLVAAIVVARLLLGIGWGGSGAAPLVLRLSFAGSSAALAALCARGMRGGATSQVLAALTVAGSPGLWLLERQESTVSLLTMTTLFGLAALPLRRSLLWLQLPILGLMLFAVGWLMPGLAASEPLEALWQLSPVALFGVATAWLVLAYRSVRRQLAWNIPQALLGAWVAAAALTALSAYATGAIGLAGVAAFQCAVAGGVGFELLRRPGWQLLAGFLATAQLAGTLFWLASGPAGT